ncbi:hypothetical protein GGR56DRAFT_673329 [Xylariaceae sp. FL0804]|nr:hypothetical protein GGR56DRAFT_673329 [Xylariaceae sp. FL0804]
MSQQKLKSSNKAPPPSLFLHPSPAASHVSLPGMAATGILPPSSGSTSNAQKNPTSGAPTQASSQQQQQQQQRAAASLARSGSLLNPRGGGGGGGRTTLARLPTSDSARTTDKTDALWAEMQATLEEVELSASGGTHVFGPEHDRKLAELRAAQIALAQAWARSEADEPSSSSSAAAAAAGAHAHGPDTEVRNLKSALGGVASVAAASAAGSALGATVPAGPGAAPAAKAATNAAAAEGTNKGSTTAGTESARLGSGGLGGEQLGAMLEEETERDILHARNRREANDRYFRKVDQGVRDVAAKLEEVAHAMRVVEQETRDVWGDESIPDSSRA